MGGGVGCVWVRRGRGCYYFCCPSARSIYFIIHVYRSALLSVDRSHTHTLAYLVDGAGERAPALRQAPEEGHDLYDCFI